MSVPSNRTIAIGGVFAVLIVAVVMGRDDATSDAVQTSARPGAAAQSAARRDMPVADVKLELLHQHKAEREASERNLFRFEARAAAVAPAGPPRPAPAPVAPPVVVPAGPPPPPPIPLRFIGLVDAPTQAGRLAILSDGRGNVFYGKDGDIIEGRYRVLHVGPETAELSYLDGRGRQTIRLTGQ